MMPLQFSTMSVVPSSISDTNPEISRGAKRPSATKRASATKRPSARTDAVPELATGPTPVGLGKLIHRFRATEKIGEGQEEEMTVDACGNDLPISVRDAARCKAIFDEAGIVNVICSKMKLELSGGWSALKRFNKVVKRLYLLCGFLLLSLHLPGNRVLGGLVFNSPLSPLITSFDNGLGDCLTAQRSFTNNTVLLASETCNTTSGECAFDSVKVEATVDMDAAELVCMEFWKSNRILLILVAIVMVVSLILRLPIPSFENTTSKLSGRSEPVFMSVFMIEILLPTIIGWLRVNLVLIYSNHYADNIVNFVADLALLLIVAELYEEFCEAMISSSRAAVQAELNEFDATFEEEFGEDPLDVLEPREEGEIPYLPLEDFDLDLSGAICRRGQQMNLIAYKKGPDGRRGTPAGLYMMGKSPAAGETSESCVWRIARRLYKQARWSSSLNSAWTTKSFECDLPAAFSCNGCYNRYEFDTHTPYTYCGEGKTRLLKAKRCFVLCKGCHDAASEEAARAPAEDEKKALASRLGLGLEYEYGLLRFFPKVACVCAKDFKEGKVVRATGEELEKIKEESKKEFEKFGPKQLHVFG
ncbi:hypothetical protein TeGR_g14285 [Tetraparma gracilis]|uniref:Uncharacterized protein n=1 Tax=Tetraparma gracilis TaxID=2962635 RepID=A0ABQ6M9U9_9STRA|nr:hypothetical protein TeGR_g14285 [Tetraparma gracilis]